MVSARLLGLATACATVLTLGLPVEQASAQGEACKAEVITVTGPRKGGVKRWTQAQELEGKGAAMDGAVEAWERDADRKFGDDWKLWSKATDKSFNCEGGKGLLSSVACTVSGRPCPSTAPDSGRVVAKKTEGPPERITRADRWDDDDDRLRGQGWGYRRAMQRQDRLAAARSRAEERAWDRETARQNFLRAERRRAESRAVERANARERYLAARRDRLEGRSRWDWDDD